MKLRFLLAPAATLAMCAAGLLYAQPAADPLVEGLRLVEVASVADAAEQLYGQRIYMSHDMRPIFTAKFAGPAVTVLLKKEEHHEGPAASQGMLDAIDAAPPGSVYVIVLEDGLDIAGIGGLMSTAMKYRGLAGAVVDASVRDLPQIKRLQFPVFSRGIVPSTSINHYRFAGANIPVTCAGARVNPNDIDAAITRSGPSSRAPVTQDAPTFVRHCMPMTKGRFIAAYITTWARANWFPFGNNFTPRFR